MEDMVSKEELKETILRVLNCFKVDLISEIENGLSLGDRISLYYLLNDDPEETLRTLKTKSSSCIVMEWCHELEHRNHSEWKLRLIESLILMQNFKTLLCLGYKKINLAEVKNLLECVKRSETFDVRKALYNTVDNLTEDELSKLIKNMDGNKTYEEPTSLYKPRFIEIYLLEWQIRGKISLETNGLKNLVTILDNLNLPYQPLQHFIENLESSEEEIDSETNCDIRPDNKGGGTTSPAVTGFVSPTDYSYPILNPDCLGLCIIVNQEDYTQSSGNDKRHGSSYDIEQLKNTMDLLKIHSCVLKNLRCNQIFPSIEDVIRKEFINDVHSLLFVVIMAHGNEDSVFGIDGGQVKRDCIRESLSNDNLPCITDKPKIIIFQSCRGSYYYAGNFNVVEADGPRSLQSLTESITKPSMNHYMICSSTIPGYKSYRHAITGSFYIQMLCECLKEFYKIKDLHSIMTTVNRRFHEESVKGEKLAKVKHDDNTILNNVPLSMVPEFTSTLVGHVYLYKM